MRSISVSNWRTDASKLRGFDNRTILSQGNAILETLNPTSVAFFVAIMMVTKELLQLLIADVMRLGRSVGGLSEVICGF